MTNPKGMELEIKVELTRKIQGATLTLGASRKVVIHNPDERRKEYDRTAEMLNDQFDHMVKMGVINAADLDASDTREPDARGETIIAEKLTLTVDKGKKYYKIMGGRYTVHGVNVWKEVIEPTGLIDDLGNNFELSLKGWKADIITERGAAKVIRLYQG